MLPHRLSRCHQVTGLSTTRLQGQIHGRRDVSGPAITAWRLHRAWLASELIIVEDEGHGGEAMVKHWTAANSRHADRIEQVY